MMEDYERTVLGACFLAEKMDVVLSRIKPDDFADEMNRAIFEAAADVAREGGIPDAVTVSGKMSEKGIKGATQRILDLVDYTPHAANMGYYADKLKDASLRRRLVNMAYEIADRSDESGKDLLETVHACINTSDDESKTSKASIVLGRVMKDMEERCKSGQSMRGIATGIHKLDVMTSGFCKEQMIVLAARPSIGKTALALNIVEQAALIDRVPTLFLSLEMGQEELIERMLLSHSRIDSGKARAAQFEAHEFGTMSKTSERIHRAPLWIDKSSGCTIAQLKAKARAAKRRHGIKLVVIDYLGLVCGKGTEYEVITDASKEVKRMAQELGIPVLCLHQLNRGNEQRQDKVPTMSDLRSSGQIEQDADVILFIHREKKTPVEDALIIIEKQRNGPCGRIPVQWHGPHNRFSENNF